MPVARVRIRLSGTFLKPGKLPGLITRPAAGSTGPGSPMPRARTRRGGGPSSSSPRFTASTNPLMTWSRPRAASVGRPATLLRPPRSSATATPTFAPPETGHQGEADEHADQPHDDEERRPGAAFRLADRVQQRCAHRRDFDAEAQSGEEQLAVGHRERQAQQVRPERAFVPSGQQEKPDSREDEAERRD